MLGLLACCAPAAMPSQPTVPDPQGGPDGALPSDAAPPGDASAPDDAAAADSGVEDGGEAPTSRACRGWPTDRPLRVLYVGNSQIDTWDLPRMISSVAASAPAGCPRMVGEAFTGGGANLGDLLTQTDDRGRTLAQRIQSGGYDVVVIAESIDLVEHRPPYPARFETDARALVDIVRAAGATPILYASPYVERPDPTPGFRMQADPQIALGRELGVPVALAGLAWLRAWAVDPTLDLYHPDRAHPGYYGSYISALVTWATITGGSPIGLTGFPDANCWPNECSAIPAHLVAIFQEAALDQVEDPTP